MAPSAHPFKCGVPGCNRSFSHQTFLSQHTQDKHPKPPAGHLFKCGVGGCNKNFPQHDVLLQHTRDKHSKSPSGLPLNCGVPGCNSSFLQRELLLQHNRDKHAKSKPPAGLPFKCGVRDCNRTFPQHDLLLQHTQVEHPKPQKQNPFTGRVLDDTDRQSKVLSKSSLPELEQLFQEILRIDPDDTIKQELKVYKNIYSLARGAVIQGKNARFCNDFQALVDDMRKTDQIGSLANNDEYRERLEKLCRSIGISDSDIVTVIKKDESALPHLLGEILCSKTLEEGALSLKGDQAERFLNAITDITQKRSYSPDDNEYYGKCHRLLIKLSKASDRFPSRWFIRDIRLENQEPESSGGFADIYKGLYAGRIVAVKKVRIYGNQTDAKHAKIRSSLYREAIEWLNLKHNYVVPFLGMSDCFPNNLPCIVSSWMENGTIIDFRKTANASQLQVDKLLREVAEGLSYLHSKNVVHGDLHGGNILIDDEWHARLTDFGLTRFLDITEGGVSISRLEGATRWMAPELFIEETSEMSQPLKTKASDVYALACVFLEVTTGEHPFVDISVRYVVMWKVMEGERPKRPPKEGIHISDGLWNVVQNCWKQEPSDRLTMTEVVDELKDIDFGV